MQNNTPNDASGMSASLRLAAAESQLAAAVSGARRRNRWNLSLWLAATVLTVGYMASAYAQFTRVDPDMAVTMAATKVKERLPEIFSALRHQARAAAPELLRHGESQLRSAPGQLESALTEHAEKQLAAHSPAIADELFLRLRTVLDEQRARQHAATAGLPAEDCYRAAIERLHEATRDHIAAVFEQQLDATGSVVDRLERLAQGRDLTERERLQREVIRSMLMLWQQYHLREQASAAATSEPGVPICTLATGTIPSSTVAPPP